MFELLTKSFLFNQSGIGIMVEGCESVDDFSEGTEDFIELPAITKPRSSVDNPELPDVNFKTSQSKSGSQQSVANLRSQSVKSPSTCFSSDSPVHANTPYVLSSCIQL